MASDKRVLIHCIRESISNLQDSIDHFRPDYVYLLTSYHHSEGKPDLALMEIENKNIRTFGDHVKKIEYVALHNIREAWHQETMMKVFEEFALIKSDAISRAKEDGVGCEFFAGLSDATGLFSPSVAFAAVLHDMKTYYTRGRRRYYHNEYVLELENLNSITLVKNWIEANEHHKENLKYLEALIEIENEGGQKITSEHITNKVQTGKRAVDKAIKKLEQQGLILVEGKKNRSLSSTLLGQLCIRMNLGGL
tara:strand:+ start:226 stop:978 length:753 start_codon:yes stop_codon:yes gene_type:complete